MPDPSQDDALAKLEHELRVSRSQAWDVETYLARRHLAKIEALTAPGKSPWARKVSVVWDFAIYILGLAGLYLLGSAAVVWLLFGEWPIHFGLN